MRTAQENSGETKVPVQAAGKKPLLMLDALTKTFGSVLAVDHVSLAIREGEFFCLLGASGCGKTTLMRMIAGFEQPDTGQLLLEGADITMMPPHERPVNMMFQSYALFPHLNLAQNISFGLHQARMSKNDVRQRVAEMIDLVQLQGLESRKPAQLSGGQKQRAALARALARQPRLLLLDEPLAALDKKLRLETQGQLKQIQHRLGTSFIVVTHDPDEAMGLADRIAVMEHGRIVQIGSAEEIYERPESWSIAAMVGDVNAFACDVSRGDTGYVSARLAEFGLELNAVPASSGVQNGRACLLVRPEHVRINLPGEKTGPFNELSPPPLTVQGVVSQLTYQGDSFLVRVTPTAKTASDVIARLPKSVPVPELGETMWFSLDMAGCRVVRA